MLIEIRRHPENFFLAAAAFPTALTYGKTGVKSRPRRVFAGRFPLRILARMRITPVDAESGINGGF